MTRRMGRGGTTGARLALAAALSVLPGAVAPSRAQGGIDAEAARSFDAEIRKYRRDCGEAITVAVKPAPISPGIVARIVNLQAGICFGQPGQNAYLVAKGPGGWRRLFSAEPGFITVLTSAHRGYADLEFESLGLCVTTWRWDGSAYVRAGSHDCGGPGVPPTVRSLAPLLRSPR